MKHCVALMIIALLFPVGADAKTASESAKYELEMRKTASSIASDWWSNFGSQFEADNVTQDEVARWSLWVVAGHSLGVCDRFAAKSDASDWIDAFGRIIPWPRVPQERRNAMYSHGLDSNELGQSNLKHMASRAAYCAARMPAVRRIVHGL